MLELEAGMATKRKKVWHRNSHCALLYFLLIPCDTSSYNIFWHVMKNLSSQAHPGTIPHSPPPAKINLFADKIFILYSSVIHSFRSKTFRLYSVWREGKRDPIFHIQIRPYGFFSVGSSFRKGFFFQVLRYIFFSNYIMAKKAEAFQKNLEII